MACVLYGNGWLRGAQNLRVIILAIYFLQNGVVPFAQLILLVFRHAFDVLLGPVHLLMELDVSKGFQVALLLKTLRHERLVEVVLADWRTRH